MNTRFNPTANGPLHLGHIYMALVNEHMAHSTNSTFILRIDDNQRSYFEKLGGPKQMHEIGMAQSRDLDWIGIQTDRVVYQSGTEELAKATLTKTHFRMVVDHHPLDRETFPIIHDSIATRPWPLSAWITAEKVVLDRLEDVEAMVRGPDLIQEHQLYMYFCALFGYRFPKCYYLPRLVAADGEISKTRENWQIGGLRSTGITPEQIRQILRESCLVNPDESWHIDNVKDLPRLSEGAKL